MSRKLASQGFSITVSFPREDRNLDTNAEVFINPLLLLFYRSRICSNISRRQENELYWEFEKDFNVTLHNRYRCFRCVLYEMILHKYVWNSQSCVQSSKREQFTVHNGNIQNAAWFWQRTGRPPAGTFVMSFLFFLSWLPIFKTLLCAISEIAGTHRHVKIYKVAETSHLPCTTIRNVAGSCSFCGTVRLKMITEVSLCLSKPDKNDKAQNRRGWMIMLPGAYFTTANVFDGKVQVFGPQPTQFPVAHVLHTTGR